MYRTVIGTPGVSVYLKPLPIIASPWASDVVVAEEAGTTGIFSVNVSAKKDYAQYEQLGDAPAPSDDFEGTLINNLRSVQAQTERIGSGTVAFNAPVTLTGKLTSIVRGDDYLLENDRAFEWIVDPVAGFDVASVDCWFGARSVSTPSHGWRVEGWVTETTDGRWRLTFELRKTITCMLEEGPYDWSVALHSGETEITRVKNKDGHRLELVTKQA